MFSMPAGMGSTLCTEEQKWKLSADAAKHSPARLKLMSAENDRFRAKESGVWVVQGH